MNLNKKVYLLEISSIILYIVLITIAMFTYGGGTKFDSNSPGYSFWGNTFSDLGRTVSYNGNINIISMVLFSIAYLGIAFGFLPFYYIFPKIFDNGTIQSKCAKLGSIFGLISSIGFLGVVLTPADLLRPPHMILAMIAYACIFFMSVFYSASLLKSMAFSDSYFYLFVIFSILFFITLMMQLFGDIISNRIMAVIGQKIGRIAIFITYSILTYKLWKLEK
jgi:uncharacterized membrane protein